MGRKLTGFWIILLAVALLLAGCLLQTQDLSGGGSSVDAGDQAMLNSDGDNKAGPLAVICLEGRVLRLQDWYAVSEIETLLGEAQSSESEVLGAGSDTFMGGHVLRNRYEGLEVTFFSPRDNRETFMVQQIVVDHPKIKTGNEVGLGSSSSELYSAYQSLSLSAGGDGETEKIQFRSLDNELITFEMIDNQVARFTIVYEFQ